MTNIHTSCEPLVEKCKPGLFSNFCVEKLPIRVPLHAYLIQYSMTFKMSKIMNNAIIFIHNTIKLGQRVNTTVWFQLVLTNMEHCRTDASCRFGSHRTFKFKQEKRSLA